MFPWSVHRKLAAGWKGVLNVVLRKVRAGSSPGPVYMSGKKHLLCKTRAFKEILRDVSGGGKSLTGAMAAGNAERMLK